MEITGKCVFVSDGEKYVSRRTNEEGVKYVFTIEYRNGDYSSKCAFTVFGGERFSKMGVVCGGTYNVSFDVTSHEWNGKWITTATAWKAVRVDSTEQPHVAQQKQQQAQPMQPQYGGDMPF